MASMVSRMLSGGGDKEADTDLTSMVTIKPKGTKVLDLTPMLSKYIAEYYDENGNAYASEIADCNQVRTASLNAPADESGCQLHLRWLTQLNFLENRFEKLFDETSAKSFMGGLEWVSTFDGVSSNAASLQSERMGLLFNLGALWAELGRRVLINAGGEPSDQNLKQAVKYFQAAGGAYTQLTELIDAHPTAVVGKDSTAHWITMLEKLMLAQAHECVLRQALSIQRKQEVTQPDKKKSEFFPKLAMQVAELYDQVHTALLVDNPNQKEYKGLHPWRNWVPSSRIKSMHARAYAHFLDSELCSEAGRYGDEVARLRAAKSLCETMGKLVKAERGMTAAGCATLFALVEERAAKAERANSAVYFEKVVSEELLPTISLPAQLLVKTEIVPLDKSEADVFAKLIPIEIHLLASEFSDAKDQLLRMIDANVASKTVDLDKALTSMGLADNSYKDTDVALPKELFIHAAALRDSSEGIAKVEATMAKCGTRNAEARSAISAVDGDFSRCRTMLDQPTAAAIEREIADVGNALDRAENIEKAKAKAWDAVQGPLRLLAGPANGVREAMPKHNVLDAPRDVGGASERLEGLLKQLKEIRVARLNEFDAFRLNLESKEVLQALATAADPPAVLDEAKRELEAAAVAIRANMAFQDSLIKDLVEANANTVQQRKFVKEHQQKQRDFIANLETSYRDFCTLRTKVTEGLHFYDGVNASVCTLQKKVKSAEEDAIAYEDSSAAESVASDPVHTPNPFRMSELIDASHEMDRGSSHNGQSGHSAASPSQPPGRTLSHSNPFSSMPPGGGHGSPHGSPYGGDSHHESPYGGSSAPPYNSHAQSPHHQPHPAQPGPHRSTQEPHAARSNEVVPLRGVLNAMQTGHEAAPARPPPAIQRGGRSQSIQRGDPGTNLDRAVNDFMLEMNGLEEQHHDGRLGYDLAWDELQAKDFDTFREEMCSVGFAQHGSGKNRYRDIVPMNETRVRLQTLSPGGDDYINASVIEAILPGAPNFIAAQGPKLENNGDFWKMVKQQRVRIIAMVTNCTEQGRSKCAQYWPDRVGETNHYESTEQGHAVSVTCTQERVFESWVERTLRVDQELPQRSSLVVQQYHFIAWPDRDVPDTPIQFLRFLHAVMAAQHKAVGEASAAGERGPPPILVHCSAGVGRTGTFIAIYSVLNSLPFISKGVIRGIDIRAIVIGMRRCRRYMVQTPFQLVFTYRTILHSATEFVTSFKKRVGLVDAGHAPPPRIPSRSVPPPHTHNAAPPARRMSMEQRDQPQRTSSGNQPLPPRQQPGARRLTSFPPVAVTDRRGNADFVNGLYRYVPGSMEKEGAPVFQRTGVVPPGHGSASGLCVYIHYHQSNKAWVITQSVNSASVIAYSATADNRLETLGKLNGTWNVTEQNGYLADPRMRVVPHFTASSPGAGSPGIATPPFAAPGHSTPPGAQMHMSASPARHERYNPSPFDGPMGGGAGPPMMPTHASGGHAAPPPLAPRGAQPGWGHGAPTHGAPTHGAPQHGRPQAPPGATEFRRPQQRPGTINPVTGTPSLLD